MKRKFNKLLIVILMILTILLSSNIVNATEETLQQVETIESSTNMLRASPGAWNYIENKLSTGTINTQIQYDSRATAFFNTLQSGGQNISREGVQSSPNIYCVDKDAYMVASGARYGKINGGTLSNTSGPEYAYLYSSGVSNTSTVIYDCQKNRVYWALNGQLSESDLYTASSKHLYNDCLAFKKYASEPYSNPTVYQTEPKSINYLAGPYKIDYTYGENGGRYIGIKDMVLKDEDGNIIQHSTTETGGARWYIANADGTPLDNGTYGNRPKPDQEFYIKVIKFYKSKAYLTFVTEKIECEAEYVKVTGSYTFTWKRHRCSDCLNKTCGKAIGSVKTLAYYCNGYATSRNPARCGKTYRHRGHYVYNYTTIYCDSSHKCESCRNAICGKVISINQSPKDPDITYELRCGTTAETKTVQSQQLDIVNKPKITQTEINLELEIKLDCVDLSLRKFVTGITDVDDVIYNADGSIKDAESKQQEVTNRIPQVDTGPIRREEGTTAIYNHTKEPLMVKAGDIVEYTIRVYNEGTANGYAEEVTDYLPTNLEFISGVVDGVDYGWKATTENGRTVLRTNYLSDKIFVAFQTEGVFRPNNVGADGLDYKDLKLICRVKDEAVANEKITNIAEVTKYKDKEGNILDGDTDSEPNNVKLPTNEAGWQNYNGAGQEGNYVKGQEDDDDFEKLTIEYTDIEGTVWKDCEEGKQEERDNVLTNRDERFANIDVELYQDREGNGNYIKIATTKTDANGHYKFDRFNVEGIRKNPDGSYTLSPIRLEVNKNYIVKFGYGGQQYEPVTVTPLTSNAYTIEKSAGHEVATERQALNASFFEIVNGTSSKKPDGSIGINGVIKYDKDTAKHTSTLIRERERQEGEAFWQASKIWSTTDSFPGTLANEKIHNINQGLYERAQINFGIMSDVKEAELVINGKSSIYEHNKRDEGKAMTIELTQEDLRTVYNQAIYKSDYMYRIEDYKAGYYEGGANPGTYGAFEDNLNNTSLKNGDELEVYITYKIKVKNYSSKGGNITELVHYYPNEYSLIESWYEKGEERGEVSWREGTDITIEETKQTGGEHKEEVTYKEIYTNGIKNVGIGANEEVYVYIKYRVNKGEDRANLLETNGYEEDGQSVLLGERYTYTEITGYSSQEGLIDLNSEPGNMKIDNIDEYVNSYEDDTDRAPGINLHIETEAPTRELSGYVFEDMIAGQDSDGVNIGNGTYEGEDKKINGVRVQLIELVEIEGKTYEYIWQEIFTGDGKTSYMDRKGNLVTNERNAEGLGEGEYRFTEYIPGNYIVRFIYGDTEKTLYYNGQDYKYTKYVGYGENSSSIRDNKVRRQEVIDYSSTITNEKGEILAATSQDNELHTELLKQTWMNADTQEVMEITVNMASPGHKVNCGIIRRPKTELTVIKEVVGLKVVHNGIIYVDTANGVETGLKKLPDGNYSLELDDELLNGAELYADYSVKIVNTGEKDTLYNYFEGDETYGTNQHELITTSADRIYDYPENIGYDEGTNPDWTTQNIDYSILKQEVQDRINQDNRLVITTTRLTKDLKPGEETDTITFTTSKLMAAGADENMIYNNVAEIVQVTNKVGRRDEGSIPGNYVPLSNITDEPDTDEATITVTDPTGLQGPQIHYILLITIGVILIVGIVLIKKVVKK